MNLAKRSFTFEESHISIIQLITKFGGQPVWLNKTEATWPLSPETGKKMLFMGQIALEEAIFPNSKEAIAYLFFADEVELLYNEAVAIVIQTKEAVYKTVNYDRVDTPLEYVSAATGEGVYELDEDQQKLPAKDYNVLLCDLEIETATPLNERWDCWNDLDLDTGYNFSKPELAGNKIGGQAIYVENVEAPLCYESEDWHLLLQLAPKEGYWDLSLQDKEIYQPNFYPFFMQMYPFSIVSIFISKDYTQTKCYIQNP
ncbi:DUF1963 domain-containing protein [Floridanema evergladense]|uniref:DUF1963 domain-containing protein n=1 Tax=Floridaenema evergladense BLCC-F167 TaxID=3153639 RepID=A0ABV4WK61_9CYAN